MKYILLNVISINQMVFLSLRHITNQFHQKVYYDTLENRFLLAQYIDFSNYLTILVNVFVFLYCMVKNCFVQTVYEGEEEVLYCLALSSLDGSRNSVSSASIGFIAILHNTVFSD